MAYLGRPGATAPLTSADIPDNSITASKIASGAITAADVAADMATQAELDTKLSLAGGTMTGDLIPSTPLSHRNMIINGGMQVWQRGTATTTVSDGYNAVDRFYQTEYTDGAYTVERDELSVADQGTTGHRYAMELNVTTADTSLASNQNSYFFTRIEAQDLQHLRWGSSSAKTLTLSFWVKSNKTGTYTTHFRKMDSTAYWLVMEYTISSANTWEQKTITVSPTAGSTSLITNSGGAIANDNGSGLEVGWSLAFGSDYHTTAGTWVATEDYSTSNQVNWMDSTSNNFFITGIQLELGSSATPFEHRSYGEELAKCQRYCWTTGDSGYGAQGITSALTSDSYHRSRFFSPQTCRHKTQALTATVTDWGATSGNSTFAFYTSLTIVTSGAGVNSQDVSGRLDAGSGGHSVLWPLNETDGTSPLIFDCEL